MKKNLNLNTKKRKGFTLMELIIAIVIIGILSGGAAVSFVVITNNAKKTQFKSNVSMIKSAVQQYYQFEKDTTKLTTGTLNDDAALAALKDYFEGGEKGIEELKDNPKGATYTVTDGTWTFEYKGETITWTPEKPVE